MKMTAFTKLTTTLSVTSMFLLSIADNSEGFVSPSRTAAPFVGRQLVGKAVSAGSEVAATATTETIQEEENNQEYGQSIRAPLKFMGPYPCLGLKFPNLATKAQQSRNVTGISLDFVLDTAANTNTINGQVAKELGLEVVGKALPGVGAGGAMDGGSTFLVGDCELEGLPKEEQFTFMQALTASALPVASPAAAGLLSLPFFHCFEGGVEFQWGDNTQEEGGLPPSITFYGPGESDATLQEMTQVPVKELPVTRLPSVDITINGITIPALLDTGSPITVINAQAAEQAGVQTVDVPGKNGAEKKGGNPLANFSNRFQQAQATAQAAARGDVLTIAGATGERVDLLKSDSKVQVELAGAKNGETVAFGNSNIYVGNLPGLAALNALGDDSPPAAVLGMDVLRLRPKMLLKARDLEVYF